MHACSLSPKSRPGAILPAWRASPSSLSSVATSHPPQQPWTLAVSRCGSGCWGCSCQVLTPDAACEGCAHRGHCGRWRCWGSRKQHPWAPVLASSRPPEQISSGTPWCLRKRPRSACGQRRVACCVASDTWNLECTELFSPKQWGLSCAMPAFVATQRCGAGPSFPGQSPCSKGTWGSGGYSGSGQAAVRSIGLDARGGPLSAVLGCLPWCTAIQLGLAFSQEVHLASPGCPGPPGGCVCVM